MSFSWKEDKKEKIVQKYFKIVKKLGEGAFGEIYLATNTLDNSLVALKIQSVLSKRSQLLNESKFIIDLHNSKSLGEEINIPNVLSICKQGNCYVMIMDLLGNSLEDLFNLCERKFTIKTTVLIGWQMLQQIKFVHSRGILHRDIKPDNFLIGKKSNFNKIYMIDFGLAKKFIDKGGQHILYRDNKDLTGTARYASVNTHLGIEQGRRDDLESWLYVLIYFAKGHLPWQSMKGQGKKEKYEKIMERKLTIPISTLTGELPKEFEKMLSYVRGLHFNSEPDYEFLLEQLQKIGKDLEFEMDSTEFDWISEIERRNKKKQIKDRDKKEYLKEQEKMGLRQKVCRDIPLEEENENEGQGQRLNQIIERSNEMDVESK